MKIVLALTALLVTIAQDTALSTTQELLHSDWALFKTKHHKQYNNDEEESSRFQIFQENRNMIIEHNKLYEQGLVSFKMAVNKFADKTREERMKNKPTTRHSNVSRSSKVGRHSNVTRSSTVGRGSKVASSSTTIPPRSVYLNWVEEGYVTEVKDQGDCGAWWAFSAVAAVESQVRWSYPKLISLSEQNVIDCSSKYGLKGCDSGTLHHTFNYILIQGINPEAHYPYTGKLGTCSFNSSDNYVILQDYSDISYADEEGLKSTVNTKGPVAVEFDASLDSFIFYESGMVGGRVKGVASQLTKVFLRVNKNRCITETVDDASYMIGIYYDSKCSSEDLNHGMVVVGYGTEDSQDYWLLKNSWGKDWGEEGYVRVARNKDNLCGVASAATYPIQPTVLGPRL
uniref:Uncharacterized protein n=1 Tax=Timema douglasi TaxID=61478 RepID=A0A7R8V9F9_TIMDO|nr:unnamed protein product [Timema douglasi]